MVVRCNLCRSVVDENATAFVKDGHRIVRCPNCRLMFRLDLPDADEIETIYSQNYFRAGEDSDSGAGYLDYVAEGERHRETARKRLCLLESYRPAGERRLLDVGCAAGFFLAEAADQGWDARGIDVSATMASWGRNRLQVEIETGLFLERPLDGPYDLITMWDYLEHTLDPRAELEKAALLLRNGGALALSTGDASSWVARLSARRWHLLTPNHHLYYFTPLTLRRYLEQEGFQLLKTKYTWSSYSLAYLTHKLQTMTESRIPRLVADALRNRGVGRIAIPINLWDIVTIVATRV